jgi:hypothetical protein
MVGVMSDYEYWQSEPLSLCPATFNLCATRERQRRLCACCLIRQVIWDILPDDLRKIVEASERFAEGEIERKRYFAVTRAARAPYKELRERCFSSGHEIDAQELWLFHAVNSVDCTTAPKFAPTTLRVALSQTWETIRWWMQAQRKTKAEKFAMTWAVKQKFARHTLEFFEYLSAPFAVPSTWPAAVGGLARALYDGDECEYALHDALEEFGQARLAEHFRTAGHPKGCWALDLILGRT